MEVLNQQLTFVWKVAQASQASGPTGEAKADSANRLSGLMSMLLVIKDDGILDDMVDKSGVQDWHSALASPSAPTTVPNIYSDEPPPELNRTVSQVRWSIADSLPRTYD